MNSRTCTGRGSTLLSMLAMTFLLVGCQAIPMTLTGGTEAAKADAEIAADVCRAGKPVTYSSRDTPETQLQARANNAARTAYCPQERKP